MVGIKLWLKKIRFIKFTRYLKTIKLSIASIWKKLSSSKEFTVLSTPDTVPNSLTQKNKVLTVLSSGPLTCRTTKLSLSRKSCIPLDKKASTPQSSDKKPFSTYLITRTLLCKVFLIQPHWILYLRQKGLPCLPLLWNEPQGNHERRIQITNSWFCR